MFFEGIDVPVYSGPVLRSVTYADIVRAHL